MGVPVEIGASLFLLLLLFVPLTGNSGDLAYGCLFIFLLITSIFLHELGHAWGALIQGVQVRRIVIYGGGGFCEQDRSATAYEDELIVAMGPIVNLVIWAVCSMAAQAMPPGIVLHVISLMATINLLLALFNLLPVMPLDGGRLFHLLMSRFTSPAIALRTAGAIGLLIALLWLPAMLLCFHIMGFVLLFFPSIKMHWQMLTYRTG